MRTIIMMQIFWKLDWQYFMVNKIMMQIFDDLQDYDGNYKLRSKELTEI